ncbi:MAG: ATP synthase F0 subunit B [Lachnospiraceae bacterium]|nr:ATP synthase F0 subunit B [Lachnospiraceae bacterium]
MLQLNWNILWTVINLLILFVLMKKFLFGPVNKIIAERQAQADAMLKDAEEAKSKAQESRVKLDEELKHIETAKSEAVSEARKSAGAEYQKIVDQANADAREILADAQKDAEYEKLKIIRSAEGEIADMIMEAAGRLSGLKGNKADGADLYEEFLDKAGDEVDES